MTTEEVDRMTDPPGPAADIPAQLVRLVNRYVVEGAITLHRIERLALMSGVTGGSAVLRRALPVAGVIIHMDAPNPPYGQAMQSELQPDAELVHEETVADVSVGQGAYVESGQEGAVAAARKVIAEDRVRARPEARTLTALEEWGLCALLRPNRPVNAELPEGFARGLSRDSEAYQAWTALLSHNTRLVWKIAKGYGDRSSDGLEWNDIFQHGVLGLMTAIRKFDVTRRNKLSTYATAWIRQSIERGIMNEYSLIRFPVHFQEAVRKIRTTQEKLSRQGIRASRENLRLETGLPAKTIDEYFSLRRNIDYLDRPVGDATLGELVLDVRTSVPGPHEALSGVFGRQRVDSLLSLLPERKAKILRLRHGAVDGELWTLEEISSIFGVTRERIRQLEVSAIKFIRVFVTGGEYTGEGPDVPLPREHSPDSALDEALRRVQARCRPALPVNSGHQVRETRPQRPAGLLRFVRASGYDLAEALVDLVDNSLVAGASTIRVSYSADPGRPWLAVMDDGRGLTDDELGQVMMFPAAPERSEPGAPGTLFTGFKAASLSQARILTVLSRGSAGLLAARTWNFGGRTGSPRYAMRADPEALRITEGLGFDGQGTVVLWRELDRLGRPEQLRRQIESTARHLGLVFHRPLERGMLKLAFDRLPVVPVDPYLRLHPATQDRGVEVLEHVGHRVRVNPVVLPHPSRLSSSDHRSAPTDRQGFYVYRGDRLVIPGGWLDLHTLDEAEDTSLARVSVVIPPEAASRWELDLRNRSVRLPTPLLERLVRLADDVRDRSGRVFARRRLEGAEA
ncbi:sigma-70 family RNA polymerase sigma factor [Nonomuraea sp. NPDC049655]|uniref:sigma-70 family RNA polymerase sigma factor n=1 Tax=Nonomuraea sp. NPDC049655 TaxID=3364355 RepID=UPI0037ABC3C7